MISALGSPLNNTLLCAPQGGTITFMQVIILHVISFLLAILIHEIGHLVAVLMAGHKVIEFSVYPISIKRCENKYTISLQKNIFSGFVAYEREINKTTWGKEVAIIASGVLANIFIGLTFILYHYLISDNGLLLIFGWTSLIVGVLNCFPAEVKELGLDCDVKKFLTMLKFKRSISKIKRFNLEKPLFDISSKPKERSNSNKAQIEFFNDDVTEMDFVVDILKTYLYLDDFCSASTMLDIHKNGSVKIGWFDAEVAIKITEQIKNEATKNGFPFKCNVLTSL